MTPSIAAALIGSAAGLALFALLIAALAFAGAFERNRLSPSEAIAQTPPNVADAPGS
jgi:hypothetical protein